MKKYFLLTIVLLAVVLFVAACGENFESSTDKVVYRGTLLEAHLILSEGFGPLIAYWELTFPERTLRVKVLEEIPYTNGFAIGTTYRILEGHIYDDVYLYAVAIDEQISIHVWGG